ncbi:PqiC family protein [Methylomicrobium sp. Wu6]|uniref:PqiC family protein n=1 Tax=Methylomicrobium sp. Wu6 TaxID=3107928 RepID=UPI002DD67B4E|nr:PqiC family protein [Methylomicrobium sp. Wu6]MEC4747117.1 PqiC family protein [Methylomicrobium sp. Wu6]
MNKMMCLYRLNLLAACLLSACASTPETHFYVLNALSLPAQFSPAEAPKRLIGVGPVTVPALLERKQIITRTGDNSITSSEFHQWAAPLKESITETLAQNLSVLLPNDIIKAYPWSAYGDMDFHVIIDIARFETNAAQTAELRVNWSIMDDKSHRLLKHGHAKIDRHQAGSGHTDTVKALSETLEEFSKQLAGSLASLTS